MKTMHETGNARGAGRTELALKLISAAALALFTLFVCNGFGRENNKDNNNNNTKNKTLNSKTFK